jgi:hypothetical protein
MVNQKKIMPRCPEAAHSINLENVVREAHTGLISPSVIEYQNT